MKSSRRRFFRQAGLAVLGMPLAGTLTRPAFPAAQRRASATHGPRPLRKPPRLKPGDTIGLISPGGVLFSSADVAIVQRTLGGLGLKTKVGRHALDRRGYFAGTDAERAADVNRMFADPEVHATG